MELSVFATQCTTIDDALRTIVSSGDLLQRYGGGGGGGGGAAGVNVAAGSAVPDRTARGAAATPAPLRSVDVSAAESVILHGNAIASLANSLLRSSRLTHLNLSANALTDVDASPLGELPRLAVLDLSSNRIERVTGMAALTALTTLRLAGNRVTSLAWLHDMHSDRHSLQHLDVTGNRVCVCVCVYVCVCVCV
jgi:hypothetical protein